jgi:hypothetical protein
VEAFDFAHNVLGLAEAEADESQERREMWRVDWKSIGILIFWGMKLLMSILKTYTVSGTHYLSICLSVCLSVYLSIYLSL